MKIPEGVSFEVHGSKLVARGPAGSVEKLFDDSAAGVETSGGEVLVKLKRQERRKNVAAVKAVEAHVRNMLEGASQGFQKKLAIVYAHFPMTIETKGSEVLIKNFLGEKSPRVAQILPGVSVKADKQEVLVSGADKEAVGQTAANIVQATRITQRDRRVFQDGIYGAE